MNYFRVQFTSDWNDGDYLENIVKLDEAQVSMVREVVAKIAKWEGSHKYDTCNWNLMESSKEELMRIHDLTSEEFDFISEYIPTDPYQGECHTLVNVSVSPWVEEEYLL